MKNKSVSFTSKIRFVDRPVYKMLEKKNFIDFVHTKPNILKADEFYSEEIRTCTGGGLVNPHKEAEGFHFLNDYTNKKNFPQLVNSLFRFVKSPERGLLVGGKEGDIFPYSLEQFEKFKKVFLERVKNVSLFQQHAFPYSETNYHYSLADDTWTLCSRYRNEKELNFNTVKSLEMLKKCFKKISIAEGDRLFIGKKEILRTDAPEIFK